MNEILIYAAIVFLMTLCGSFSQILLKSASGKSYKSVYLEYFNVRVIVAYGIFFISTAVNMYLLRFIPLSMLSVLGASTYIFVPTLSWLILKERLNKKQILGLALIVLGLIVFI